MADLSMTEVWEDSRSFIIRERALLFPLGLATFGASALLVAFLIPEHPVGTPVVPGPWMLGMIPIILMVLGGYLAISRMALRTRLSVAEAIRDAIRLLPRAIGLALVLMGVITILAMIAGLIAGLVAPMAGLAPQLAVAFTVAIMLPPMLWISIRLVILWPVLADREGSVRDTLQRTLALTRNQGLRIAGILLLNFLAYMVLSVVLELAAGSLLLIVTRLLGAPTLGPVLVAILMAGFNAVYLTFWSVFLARLYCRLIK